MFDVDGRQGEGGGDVGDVGGVTVGLPPPVDCVGTESDRQMDRRFG